MSKQNELFGKKCRDKITGFVGVCTERIVWMYGCDQYHLRPLYDPKANSKDAITAFEEHSLEVLDTVIEIDPCKDEFGNQDYYFGKLCRDKVTGFEGVCTGRLTSIFCSDLYCLAPKSKKKTVKLKPEWFDEGRLEILGTAIAVDDVKAERPGGVNSYPDFSAEYAVFQR